MISFSRNIQPYLLANIEKAYSDKSPFIQDLDIIYGQGCSALWVKAQLLNIDLIANMKESADMSALDKFANLFIARYGTIKLTEFLLFCARVTLGQYGRFYGYFDPIIIGDMFKKFKRERVEELESIERKRNMLEMEQRMNVVVERNHKMPDELRERLMGGKK